MHTQVDLDLYLLLLNINLDFLGSKAKSFRPHYLNTYFSALIYFNIYCFLFSFIYLIYFCPFVDQSQSITAFITYQLMRRARYLKNLFLFLFFSEVWNGKKNKEFLSFCFWMIDWLIDWLTSEFPLVFCWRCSEIKFCFLYIIKRRTTAYSYRTVTRPKEPGSRMVALSSIIC